MKMNQNQNQQIKELHEMLGAQYDALWRRLGESRDPTEAATLLLEMREILHRLDLAQNLLFCQAAKELTQSMGSVRQANKKLAKAIAQAGQATKYLKASTEFLTCVDQALDLAKRLMLP